MVEGRAWMVEGRAWMVEGRAWMVEGRAWMVEGRGSVKSGVEVGVENPDLGYRVHGEAVVAGALTDGLWTGGVIDAERPGLVRCHVRVDPTDGVMSVGFRHRMAGLGADVIHGNVKTIGEGTFHQIAWHWGAPFGCISWSNRTAKGVAGTSVVVA
jgi:hypothetical protein